MKSRAAALGVVAIAILPAASAFGCPSPFPARQRSSACHSLERARSGRTTMTSYRATDGGMPRELVESVMVDEINKSASLQSSGGEGNVALSALKRAVEIGSVLGGRVVAPILTSLALMGDYHWPGEQSGGWEAFWSTSTVDDYDGNNKRRGEENGKSTKTMTHAQRLASALETLGPTYVKFGQALGSRPDVVPPSLAAALSSLQDDMAPFDSTIAREIITSELKGRVDERELEELLESLQEEVPVAAASIGQVYKAKLPSVASHHKGAGEYVAVKVQRPGVRRLVERDAELLLTMARFSESIPALPSQSSSSQSSSRDDNASGRPTTRLINTELVSATQEFMSRIFEELDYRNEASNIRKFSDLYSKRDGGASGDVSVVVPRVYTDWCTENVLVMEWIDGTKLTDVRSEGTNATTTDVEGEGATTKENLALVKAAIDSTLSQLLVTGVLHADPHAGNLLKVRGDDGSIELGYLDFGLLSTIPGQVRDALICSCALQVFERDVDAVSSLFGELRLIPQEVLDDDVERAALADALRVTFENSLLYPDPVAPSAGDDEITSIPNLKFDKLLDSLARLVPRFKFDLPPYFINNARALSTLEGIAKSLDPSFNVLTVMYPYALNRLLRNPTGSPVVERTLQSLMRSSETGEIDRGKIRRLLRDSALISGVSKRRVVWDIIKTQPGRKLTRGVLREELSAYLTGRRVRNRASSNNDGGRRKKRKKRWYYLEL